MADRNGSRRADVYAPPTLDDERMTTKQTLADAVRALIDDVVMLDATAATNETLAGAVAAVRTARQAVAALPSLRGRDRADWPAAELPLTLRSPFVGVLNPLAAPMQLARDGAVTRGWAEYGPAYEGGPGDMHGGAVAAAFDDLLGCAQMVGPVTGRTGTLTVRFRAPSPLGARIEYEGKLDRVEGRKAFCSGQARAGGTLLAEAEAIFVAPAPGDRSGGN